MQKGSELLPLHVIGWKNLLLAFLSDFQITAHSKTCLGMPLYSPTPTLPTIQYALLQKPWGDAWPRSIYSLFVTAPARILQAAVVFVDNMQACCRILQCYKNEAVWSGKTTTIGAYNRNCLLMTHRRVRQVADLWRMGPQWLQTTLFYGFTNQSFAPHMVRAGVRPLSWNCA